MKTIQHIDTIILQIQDEVGKTAKEMNLSDTSITNKKKTVQKNQEVFRRN